MRHGCRHQGSAFAGSHLIRAFLGVVALAASARADALQLFDLERTTGDKPQSKLFHASGSDWAVLAGPAGLAIFQRVDDAWEQNTILGGMGRADVKLSGDEIHVLVSSSQPMLHHLAFDELRNVWVARAGSPQPVPKVHASETMVLERDSRDRLWFTAEGDHDIQVYYTSTAAIDTWSTVGLVLESGVDDDDIASIITFGGDKIGVFWSDQIRDAFGFRFHRDGDPPEVWSAIETVYPGPGHADDHIHLAHDSRGRVFAITKDDFNRMNVHRRDTDGRWTTAENVLGGKGNRGIIKIDEEDRNLFILYANKDRQPASIDVRRASPEDLVFGRPRTFLSTALALDDVTGMKGPLPRGRLVAIATDSDSVAWWRAVDPEDPTEVVANVNAMATEITLDWQEPVLGAPDGYHVYRSEAGSPFHRINPTLITSCTFLDLTPTEVPLCYRVTAVVGDRESSPSLEERIDNTPLDLAQRLRLRIAPNPFNPSTRVQFHLSWPQQVEINLYGVRGQRVRTILDASMPAGDHEVTWSGSGPGLPLAAGTYFLALRVGDHLETRKITLLE